jgi:hypothetical protein
MDPCVRRDDVSLVFKQSTRLRDLAAWFARGLPSILYPLGQRAQGKPGARCTRGLVCKFVEVGGTRAYRFSGGIRLSLRSGLRLIRAHPGDPDLLVTVAGRITSAGLTPTLRLSGPHDFARPLWHRPSRVAATSTAPHPYVRDVRETPLRVERDGKLYIPVFISGKQKYFFAMGLTLFPIIRSDLPVGWIH